MASRLEEDEITHRAMKLQMYEQAEKRPKLDV